MDLLGNDNSSVILINNKLDGDFLLCGLAYFDPNLGESEIVRNHEKTISYRVFLPEGCQKNKAPSTGVNLRIRCETVD